MSEKHVASIKTLARYEPDTVYIGSGEYVAECVRADYGDYYLAADVDAAIEALQAEVEEWKDAARCASEQQDSLFREVIALNERADKLRAEVERVNSWNERVSVCRDHVTDIVDDPCVICALNAVEAHADRMWAEADRLAKEVIRIQQQYDERTACVIVHRGSALACSDAVRSAYLDEHHRAERLAEALRQIANQGPHYGPDGTYKTWRHWAEIARAALEQEEGHD